LASVDKGAVADDVVIQGDRDEKEEDKQPDDRKREWSGELKLEDLLSELEGGKWGSSEVEEKVAAPLEQVSNTFVPCLASSSSSLLIPPSLRLYFNSGRPRPTFPRPSASPSPTRRTPKSSPRPRRSPLL
jgi:hypothetical protein